MSYMIGLFNSRVELGVRDILFDTEQHVSGAKKEIRNAYMCGLQVIPSSLGILHCAKSQIFGPEFARIRIGARRV